MGGMQYNGYKDLKVNNLAYKLAMEIFEETKHFKRRRFAERLPGRDRCPLWPGKEDALGAVPGIQTAIWI